MKETLLNEICELIVDCPHSTAYDEGKGYPLVRTPNIGRGRLIYDGMHRVCEDVYNARNARAVPQENDLIFAREATAGNVAIIQKDEKVCLGQRTVLIRPNSKLVDPNFLAYFLLAPKQQYNLLSTANGATVAHVNMPTIRNLKLELPEFSIQKRIATILSRYDTLIENYQKQIKLLEEAAQRLYKEWFVDLRFPGYEKVKVVDGVPEGWVNTTIGEMGCSIESGSRPKGGIDNNLTSGYVSVGAENVIGLGKYNYTSEKLISSDFYDNMKRGKIKDRDILIYKDGAYIGRTSLFQDSFPHKAAAVNEHVFLLHANDDNYQYYLFFTLYQKVYFEKMQKLNKNAAQPGINQQLLSGLDLILPTKSLVEQFNSFVTPVLHGIFDYAKQIHSLTESRDRLLPRLMSGEVEV